MTKHAPASPPRQDATRESDRLQRPQPPAPIPPRVHTAPAPGLLAHALLGNRVFK